MIDDVHYLANMKKKKKRLLNLQSFLCLISVKGFLLEKLIKLLCVHFSHFMSFFFHENVHQMVFFSSDCTEHESASFIKYETFFI